MGTEVEVDAICDGEDFLIPGIMERGEYGLALGTGYAAFLEQLVEQFPVLRRVDILRARSENAHAHIGKMLGELYRGLSAKLHNAAIGLLGYRELFDELLEKCGIPRPKGETVFTTEQALKAANELGLFLERPHAVNRAVVKLYALTYADRSRAENYHLFLSCGVLLYKLRRWA